MRATGYARNYVRVFYMQMAKGLGTTRNLITLLVATMARWNSPKIVCCVCLFRTDGQRWNNGILFVRLFVCACPLCTDVQRFSGNCTHMCYPKLPSVYV